MKLYKLKIKTCSDCPERKIERNILSCPKSNYQTDVFAEILPDCPLGDWPDCTDLHKLYTDKDEACPICGKPFNPNF